MSDWGRDLTRMNGKPVPDEWMKTNRHLQTVGTATCSVSELIMLADNFGSGSAAQFQLMSAAREIIRFRQSARAFHAAQRAAKRMRKMG